MPECTGTGFNGHDYSLPPHNTPDDPRDAEDKTACQAQSADMPPWCQHQRTYEIVIFQIATHDWIRMFACVPCTATLRKRHQRLGPRGTDGIARISSVAASQIGGRRETMVHEVAGNTLGLLPDPSGH